MPNDFEVKLQRPKDISNEELADARDNGIGKDYSNYIRVLVKGETKYLFNDAMEPEDARFNRDLSWIKDLIVYAYETGFSDGIETKSS